MGAATADGTLLIAFDLAPPACGATYVIRNSRELCMLDAAAMDDDSSPVLERGALRPDMGSGTTTLPNSSVLLIEAVTR